MLNLFYDVEQEEVLTYNELNNEFDVLKEMGETECDTFISYLESCLKASLILIKNYNHLANLYAEKYGIIDYKVQENKMIYYINYHYERVTYRVVVDLELFKEEERIRLSRFYKKGYRNSWC